MSKKRESKGRSKRSWQVRAAEFLQEVWRDHDDCTVFLSRSNTTGSDWTDVPIHVDDNDAVLDFFDRFPRQTNNLYFSPNGFRKPLRRKQYADWTNLAWSDCDDFDPVGYDPQPEIVWETSPGRFQTIWLLPQRIEPLKAEGLSKHFVKTYGGDNGWSITKVLRIPFTFNHKYPTRPLVRLIQLLDGESNVSLDNLDVLPNSELSGLEIEFDEAFFSSNVEKLTKKFRQRIPNPTKMLLKHRTVKATDKSVAVFQIVCALDEAGATPKEIGVILWGNPYFLEKRGHDRKELRAEIVRILGKRRVRDGQ